MEAMSEKNPLLGLLPFFLVPRLTGFLSVFCVLDGFTYYSGLWAIIPVSG